MEKLRSLSFNSEQRTTKKTGTAKKLQSCKHTKPLILSWGKISTIMSIGKEELSCFTTL